MANLAWPLYEDLKRQLRGQGYIQLDETPIKVLDQRKKGKCHRGWHWVYHSPIEHMVFFDYQQGRGREGPRKLLTDLKGYLQTDGCKVYELSAVNALVGFKSPLNPCIYELWLLLVELRRGDNISGRGPGRITNLC